MKKRKQTMQPNEEIPTAQPVSATSPSEENLLAELRLFFTTVDAICAMDRLGSATRNVQTQRMELAKLRERMAAALRRHDKPREMDKVPEGGDS